MAYLGYIWTLSGNKDWFIKLSNQKQTVVVSQSSKSWVTYCVILAQDGVWGFPTTLLKWSCCWEIRFLRKRSRWFIQPFCERWVLFCFTLFCRDGWRGLGKDSGIIDLQWFHLKFFSKKKIPQTLRLSGKIVSFVITISILTWLQGPEAGPIFQKRNL